jgi:hypothetical protein
MSKRLGYTKGKWYVRANADGNGNTNDYPLVISIERLYGYILVAGVYEAHDARIIAAAPEMYEALKAIADGIKEGQEIIGQGRLEKLIAALSKAEGGLND